MTSCLERWWLTRLQMFSFAQIKRTPLWSSFYLPKAGLSCSVAFNGSTSFANVLIAQPQMLFALSHLTLEPKTKLCALWFSSAPNKKNPLRSSLYAEGRTRTGTWLPTQDFESSTSTNFITSA